MPRRQKSKLRALEKSRQAQSETQGLKDAQATAAEVEEAPSLLSGGFPPSAPAPDPSQEPQGAPATSSPDAGVTCPRSDASAKSQGEETPSASQAARPTPRVRKDLLARQVTKMMQYLLEKLNRKEPITQAALLKFVKRKYQEHFPEILKGASERMELVFGLQLKEDKPNRRTYSFVNKLGLPIEGDLSSDEVLPKTGFLMVLLGVIFMKGNRATEEEIWEYLKVLGVRPERSHPILGEPREFVTKDLVQQKYLAHRQVPNSDPPCYVFLWGPRAHTETSKMKVLEVMAKINNTVPNAFPNLYEEALRDDEDKAWLRAAVIVGPFIKASFLSRAMSGSTSHV